MASKNRGSRQDGKSTWSSGTLTTEQAGRMGGRKVAELIERGKRSEGSKESK